MSRQPFCITHDGIEAFLAEVKEQLKKVQE